MDELEDGLSDIMAKAQRGLGIATSTLAEAAGLDAQVTRGLRTGDWSVELIRAVAPHLDLDPANLLKIAHDDYQPPTALPEGITQVSSAAPLPGYPEMRVHAYLIFDPEGNGAVLFDTGTEADAILKQLHLARRKLAGICITHAHWDHVHVLDELHAAWPEAPILHPPAEPVEGARPFPMENEVRFGGLGVCARSTPGHSPGAISYLVTGLSRPAMIVGDSIFAASIGGVPSPAYRNALESIRRNILSLPEETVLCPGHGSLTTVGYERAHNPFFPQAG